MPNGWIAPYAQLADLLDAASGVLYCLKDVDGRYLAVNQAFVERTSGRSRRDVLGRRARDLFPADLAARYEAQDEGLRAGGQPVRDELELITGADGRPGWYVTSKQLVHGVPGAAHATALGIAAVSVDLGREREHPDGLAGLHEAVEHVHRHLARTVTVDELAAVAGLSVAQLERRMKRVFGVSPKQYVVKARVEEATRLLLGGERPLSEVALACGWYDQSAFTRQFTRIVGCTPGEYRSQPSRGTR